MEDDRAPGESGELPDDRVGYGRPPKHSQFRKGICPNPKGRPKGARGRKAILERIVYELVEVRVGSFTKQMTRLEAVLLAVRNAMANGNAAATKLYDKLLNEVPEEGLPVPKGIFFSPEKLTIEEWEKRYGSPGP